MHLNGGDDFVTGGVGNDIVTGGWGFNSVYAGEGNDALLMNRTITTTVFTDSAVIVDANGRDPQNGNDVSLVSRKAA